MSFHNEFETVELLQSVTIQSSSGYIESVWEKVKDIEVIFAKDNNYLLTSAVEQFHEQYKAFTYEQGIYILDSENAQKQAIRRRGRVYSIRGVDERSRRTCLTLRLVTRNANKTEV